MDDNKEQQPSIVVPIDDDLAIYANKWYGFSFKPNESAYNYSLKFLDTKVFLELKVKVKDNWMDNESLLKNFGYKEEK